MTELEQLEKTRVFVSNKFGTRNYQEKPTVTPFEVMDWLKEYSQLDWVKAMQYNQGYSSAEKEFVTHMEYFISDFLLQLQLNKDFDVKEYLEECREITDQRLKEIKR